MRNKKPSIIISYIEDFLSRGWNKKQATSLAWAEFFEEKQAEVETRYQGNVDGTIRIDCYCKDCKDGGQLLPGTTIMWLNQHKDHNTTTRRLR